MKKIIHVFFVILTFCISPSISSKNIADIEFVGDYSNIVTAIRADPHQSGYAVTLYRQSDGFYFGDFTYAMGSTEAVGSPLINLKILGNRIGFVARTSSGMDINGSPSKEFFEFSGLINRDSIQGILLRSDGKNMKSKRQRIKIRLTHSSTVNAITPRSYEEYLSYAPRAAW